MTRDEAAKRLTGKRKRWWTTEVPNQQVPTWAVEGGAGNEFLGYIAQAEDGQWHWMHPRQTDCEWVPVP